MKKHSIGRGGSGGERGPGESGSVNGPQLTRCQVTWQVSFMLPGAIYYTNCDKFTVLTLRGLIVNVLQKTTFKSVCDHLDLDLKRNLLSFTLAQLHH